MLVQALVAQATIERFNKAVLLRLARGDVQKGFDGLTALASQVLGADPYSGHLFLFRGKRGD